MSPGRCVLITGASSGLGAEFAKQLAGLSSDLVLVARRIGLLENLSAEIAASFPAIKIHCIQADLTLNDDIERLIHSLGSMELCPDLLINNAGMGDYGEFCNAEWGKVDAMLQLNMVALTRLTRELLPGMIEKAPGDIINVSSLASALPIPDFAAYAASKAYVTSFSEALRMELHEHRINVLALCPGPVHTGFGEVAQRGEHANVTPGGELVYIEACQVVKEAINAMEKGKAVHYPGTRIALAATMIRMLPMKLIRLFMSRRPRRGDSAPY